MYGSHTRLHFFPLHSIQLSTSIISRCMTIYSHMKCPLCTARTEVYNSRPSHESTQTWRRRICAQCKSCFTTREKIDWNGSIKVGYNDQVMPYNRDRLLLSIVRASNGTNLAPEMISELTDSIEIALARVLSKAGRCNVHDITNTAITVLASHNTHLALQYVQHVYNNQPPLSLIKQLVGS